MMKTYCVKAVGLADAAPEERGAHPLPVGQNAPVLPNRHDYRVVNLEVEKLGESYGRIYDDTDVAVAGQESGRDSPGLSRRSENWLPLIAVIWRSSLRRSPG